MIIKLFAKENWHIMAVLGFKYGYECSYDRYMQFIIRYMNLLTVHQKIKQITNENKNQTWGEGVNVEAFGG